LIRVCTRPLLPNADFAESEQRVHCPVESMATIGRSARIAAQATTGTSSRFQRPSEPETVRVRRAAPVKIIHELPPERRLGPVNKAPGDAE
jgi:hypothetical protein